MDVATTTLVVGLLVSVAGFALFRFGQSRRRPPQTVTGLIMMFFPCVVDSPPPMLLVGGGLWIALGVCLRLGL